MILREFQMKMTIRLRAAGVETPDLDARLLIMHGAEFETSDMIIQSQVLISPKVRRDVEALVDRRLSGEPIDHILGYRDFYGRRFKITKDVLSPRPETEGLVEQALKIAKDIKAPTILDLGTGSGAIIISILAENERAAGQAVDISDKALNIARENAAAHNVTARLGFMKGHWFDAVTGKYDIIISNPPYITDQAMETLDPEVANYDPDIALRGGVDGLDPYKEIIRKARSFLSVQGTLMFEIGFDQGRAVSSLMKGEGFQNIRVLRDLSRHDRIVIGQIN